MQSWDQKVKEDEVDRKPEASSLNNAAAAIIASPNEAYGDE